VIRTTAGLLFLLCITGRSFPTSVNSFVRGVIADASGHKPLAAAAIIQEYPGVAGIMVKDSAFSDSQGNFHFAILDSNRFAHSIVVEKDGYKTRTVILPPIDAQNILIDTIFLVRYTTLDSVTYLVSGAVVDTDNEGVRGAVVSIMLSRGAAVIFSIKDTASQWGGYFNVTTRQQFQPSPVTVRVQVQVPGFFPADMSQTLAASAQNFIFNLVLKKNSASTMVPAARTLTKAIIPSARTYTVNGRLVETDIRHMHGMAVVRTFPDGSGRVNVQLK
jgi:hypothetical protein